MKQTLLSIFALDIRALAALRIGFGLMLLADVGIRAQSVTAHLSDDGVMPRSVRMQLTVDHPAPWWLSLNMLSGENWWQVLLLSVMGIAAFFATIGYRTRIALIVSQILLIGIQGRNPYVLQGGDDFLRCMMFWCLFLPMGAVWSIDAILAKRRHGTIEQTSHRIASWATGGLILQLCALYWFSALMKTGEPWRSTFDAAYIALCSDQFTTSIGYWFTQFPELLRGLTVGTLAWEFFGPFLVFVPILSWRGPCRMIAAAGFIGMHIGLNLCFSLGLFSWICGIAWLVILPTGFWDWVVDRFPRLRTSHATESDTLSIQTSSMIANLFLMIMIVYLLLVNVFRIDRPLCANVPLGPLQTLGKSVGLDQHWIMFSPSPPPYGSWIIMTGTLKNGCEINLWHPEQTVSGTKPISIAGQYDTVHWRVSFLYLISLEVPEYNRSFLKYHVRQWNDSHSQDEQIVSAEIIIYYKYTLADHINSYPADMETMSLATHTSLHD